jgi:hypothetical protein
MYIQFSPDAWLSALLALTQTRTLASALSAAKLTSGPIPMAKLAESAFSR